MTSFCRRAIGVLRRVNRLIAVAAGLVLAATVVLIVTEVAIRQTSLGGIGGAEELSGYAMAIVSTWGFSYALTERAHVRIDLLLNRLPLSLRTMLDLVAMASILVVAAIVAWYGWGVLASSLEQNSTANTPLATPLWLPQSLWFAAWVWLTIVSGSLLVAFAGLALGGDLRAIELTTRSSGEAET